MTEKGLLERLEMYRRRLHQCYKDEMKKAKQTNGEESLIAERVAKEYNLMKKTLDTIFPEISR